MPLFRLLSRVMAAAAFAAFAACATQPGAPKVLPAGSGTFVRVVDGDTVVVRLGAGDESVRLIGIDTPETHGRGGLRECFGQEASNRTKALLPPGTRVRLVRDAELRDRYDRLLAYIYRADDDLFVNLTLAEEGYAAAYTFPPNVAHANKFVEAAAAARSSGRGLWSACGGPDTPL
ncbi:MAG: thermonuclease family protein [Acidimicrobiales bacterium]